MLDTAKGGVATAWMLRRASSLVSTAPIGRFGPEALHRHK